VIENLSPELLFNLLFVAEGHRPQYAEKVDPAKGSVEIKLQATPALPADPRCIVRGRVTDPDNEPVVGAAVTADFARYVDGKGGSRCEGVDPLAITSARGEFTILSEKPLRELDLFFKARSLAPRNVPKCPAGRELLDIRLERGATLRGRLLHDGQPVPDVAMGLVQLDRRPEVFVGAYTIGTDRQGFFTFNNVTADYDYAVYGKMESLRALGAMPVHTIKVGRSDSVVSAGDLAVVPGLRIRGQVVLSDGASVPAGTRLYLGRDVAWDSLLIDLDGEGRFEAQRLPAEVYSVGVHVSGYRYSPRNPSLDTLNQRLIGRVERDIDNLTILLEPGERPPWNPEGKIPRDEPLRGVPEVNEHPTATPATEPTQ
jgi:hypothetical protein